MAKYWKASRRDKKQQYRCTAKHIAAIEKIKEDFNAKLTYSSYSTADILENAIQDLYKKLFKKDIPEV